MFILKIVHIWLQKSDILFHKNNLNSFKNLKLVFFDQSCVPWSNSAGGKEKQTKTPKKASLQGSSLLLTIWIVLTRTGTFWLDRDCFESSKNLTSFRKNFCANFHQNSIFFCSCGAFGATGGWKRKMDEKNLLIG